MATRQQIGPRIRKLARNLRGTEPAETPARRSSPPIRVLVATDASRAASAAVKFASVMAEHGAWEPEALTVIEHLPIAVAEVALPPAPIVSEPEMTQGVIAAAKRQLRRFGGASWTLRVQFGGAAHTIAEQAKQRAAKLVVLGLGRHGRLARLFGAETAARVCRLSDTPVFAVDSNASTRPRTALVAMDFGESSVRAARTALSLLAPGGRLHLLHVRWAVNGKTLTDPSWERTYALGVEQAFARLQEELGDGAVRISTETRAGNVVETILKVASHIDADVIAAGSHSQNVIDRLLIGSTPAQLLRAAKCSILIAPPEAKDE